MFLGYAVLYALRTNLSVAIVDMVKISSSNLSSYIECGRTTPRISQQGENKNNTQRFEWSSSEQGIILGGWFYGFVSSQIIGGILADRFSPTYLFATGIGLTSGLSLLTPISTQISIFNFSYGGIFALRFLQGAVIRWSVILIGLKRQQLVLKVP